MITITGISDRSVLTIVFNSEFAEAVYILKYPHTDPKRLENLEDLLKNKRKGKTTKRGGRRTSTYRRFTERHYI